MIKDKDLSSMQETRERLSQAETAQAQLAKMDQDSIDEIVVKMTSAAKRESQRLAEMAAEETGFGKKEDKLTKNLFAANDVYDAIKDMKTVGLLNKDQQKQVWEIAIPYGVVAGIVPSTNPTSTTIFKSLIAIKSGNAIVFGPHPSASKCTVETVNVMQKAAEDAGAPEGIITCITESTLASSQELMTHEKTDVILATGGPGMVKAAYSSGKPAYGVGPGNVPSYIHESADVPIAARHICESKSFDYGTICSSEQEIIVDQSIKRKAVAELKEQGAYFLDEHDKSQVASILLKNGSFNSEIAGKSPQAIAKRAGIVIPDDTKVLIAEESEVGKSIPFSIEKLTSILALYTVENWNEASTLCDKLLDLGGHGHTLGVHSEDDKVIEAFGFQKTTSRIVVNSGTTFGAIGATTGIQPSMTLGCGSSGGNITSDNLGPQHLFNKKRVAFGIKEMNTEGSEQDDNKTEKQESESSISRSEITEIVKSVLEEMKL